MDESKYNIVSLKLQVAGIRTYSSIGVNQLAVSGNMVAVKQRKKLISTSQSSKNFFFFLPKRRYKPSIKNSRRKLMNGDIYPTSTFLETTW